MVLISGATAKGCNLMSTLMSFPLLTFFLLKMGLSPWIDINLFFFSTSCWHYKNFDAQNFLVHIFHYLLFFTEILGCNGFITTLILFTIMFAIRSVFCLFAIFVMGYLFVLCFVLISRYQTELLNSKHELLLCKYLHLIY